MRSILVAIAVVGCGASSQTPPLDGPIAPIDAPLGCGGPETLIPAWAAAFQPTREIYVSPGGSDANDGATPATAFLTIPHALTSFGPGVRLNLGAGTYPDGIYIQDFLGGTANPGAIRSSDGPHMATLAGGGLYLSHVQGIVVDGLELAGSPPGAHGFQIDSGSGFATDDLSSDIVILHSYIHDDGLANIKVAQSQRITIIGNQLSGTGPGRQNVELVVVDDAIIAGNDGSNSGAFNEIKGGSKRGIIYGNVAHDMQGGILIGGACTGQQFMLDTTIDYEAQDLRVWGNVLYNLGGTTSTSAFPVVGCQRCVIANNTVYNAATLPMTVRLLDDGFGDAQGNCTIPVTNSDIVLRDNIFVAQFAYMFNVSADYIAGFATTMTVDHNLYFGLGGSDANATYTDVPFIGEPASLYNVDPLLTSPPADVHLLPASPAIGAGLAIAGIPTAADGTCWSAPPDLGAL